MLIGNIVKEPEMRFMSSGNAVLNFSMAMTVKLADRDNGEIKELTEWVDISVFGKLAETMNNYLTSGKVVYVEGHLHTRSWESEESGEKKYRTGVIAQNIIILSPKAPEASEPELEATLDEAVEIIEKKPQPVPAGRPVQAPLPANRSTKPAGLPAATRPATRAAMKAGTKA
jgi:single-strand DNA-binding protein